MNTVLVVDDDALIVKMISMTLKASGYDVITAANGQEGLKIAYGYDPDVILLDIMMPVMDGLTMLEELRQTSDTPVIMISAYGSADKIDKARKLGIECFLNKPFKPDVLVEILDVIFMTEL